jgi:hypothetical protein
LYRRDEVTSSPPKEELVEGSRVRLLGNDQGKTGKVLRCTDGLYSVSLDGYGGMFIKNIPRTGLTLLPKEELVEVGSRVRLLGSQNGSDGSFYTDMLGTIEEVNTTNSGDNIVYAVKLDKGLGLAYESIRAFSREDFELLPRGFRPGVTAKIPKSGPATWPTGLGTITHFVVASLLDGVEVGITAKWCPYGGRFGTINGVHGTNNELYLVQTKHEKYWCKKEDFKIRDTIAIPTPPTEITLNDKEDLAALGRDQLIDRLLKVMKAAADAKEMEARISVRCKALETRLHNVRDAANGAYMRTRDVP